MSPKILRRCTVCGNFHASYLVEDAALGKAYLCYKCWKASHSHQNSSEPCPGEQPPAAPEQITKETPEETRDDRVRIGERTGKSRQS